MEAIMSYVHPFFDWLFQTTLIASVVICMILLIQKTLSGKLGPRWCHALWLVLLIRMVLPWAPSSRISPFNLIPSWDMQIQPQQLSETTRQQEVFQSSQTPDFTEATLADRLESVVEVQKQTTPKPWTLVDMQKESKNKLASLRRALPIIWLAGAVVIGAYLLMSDFALWRIVKRDSPLINQTMLKLFEECKAQMGVQSLVAVVPSCQIRSPGLFRLCPAAFTLAARDARYCHARRDAICLPARAGSPQTPRYLPWMADKPVAGPALVQSAYLVCFLSNAY